MDNHKAVKEDHNHNHESHNHGKILPLTNIKKAFVIGIVLNLLYVSIQVIIGLHINSLSLLSDAGHNFLDVGALALSLLAFKLTKAKATEKYTYGFKKSSILISLLNAVVLLISIGAIAYEAINRFRNPQPLPGLTVAIVSAIGIFINGVSAFMFFRDRKSDMNIKAAFLHLMTDALVSLALVAGGLLIYYTHLYWIDPALSIIVCIVIVASTWKLLTGSFRLSIDGVPDNVDLHKIKEVAEKTEGLEKIHHVHVWAISTTQNALTAHIIVNENKNMQEIAAIKQKLKHDLQHLNIHHVTLETETNNTAPKVSNC